MSKVKNTNQKTNKNERAQENTHCAISVMNLQQALTAVDGHLLHLRVLRNGVEHQEFARVGVVEEVEGEGRPETTTSHDSDLEVSHGCIWVKEKKGIIRSW